MTEIKKSVALLREAHDALAGMSDSDLDWFEDEEEEAEAVPAQYAARKVMQAIELLDAKPFDEPAERQQFEDAAYAHYLKKRADCAAEGRRLVFDSDEQPKTREEMFVRTPGGDYVVIAYQMAWGGWKLARGG